MTIVKEVDKNDADYELYCHAPRKPINLYENSVLRNCYY